MQTHRETILQAVQQALSNAGLCAYRSRLEAFDRDQLPAVVLKPGEEQAMRLGNRVMSRSFQIHIEVHAAADSAQIPPVAADQVADAVIAQVHAALFGTDSLGGIVNDLVDKEMQEPSFADADETRVVITLIYEALYATSERTITTNY